MKKYLLIISFFILSLYTAQGQRKFGKITNEEVKQTAHQVEADASAAILYRDYYTSFEYVKEKGFHLETTVHEVVKIYSSEGYEWANIEIPLYKGKEENESVKSIKGTTYNFVNGKVVKDKLGKDGVFEEKTNEFKKLKKITMPNIQDGSVIEYKYTFVSPFTFDINEFVFQEEIPVDEVHMRFYAPEYYNYRSYGKGWVPFKIKDDGRSGSITTLYTVDTSTSFNVQTETRTQNIEYRDVGYIVDINNVPSIKEEAFSPDISNYTSGLQFELVSSQFPNGLPKNYSTTWEDVAKRIYQATSFGGELKKTGYYKKDIESHLINVTTEEEKIEKIYSFVKNRMNWNGYTGVYTNQGVSKAYKEKVGSAAEINLMLTSILQFAGIEANPVLISTKSNGIPLFPNLNAYNYVVSGIQTQNGVLLMDGVDKYSSINLLGENLLNWEGRLIKKDGSSETVILHPNKPAVHQSMVDLEFDEDLLLKGTVKSRYSGHFGRSMRRQIQNLDKQELNEMIVKQTNNASPSEIVLTNQKNTSKSLSLNYNLEELEMSEAIGDKIYVSPALFMAMEENVFKTEDRAFPIDFNYARQQSYITNIKIPEGYEIESLPEKLAINLSDNMAQYRFEITLLGDNIKMVLNRKINTHLISADKYLDLKAYYKLIVEKEAEKIVLKKI